MKWLMAQTNSIPIYRRQDADGTDPAAQVSPEELARPNEATFGRCYDYLGQGGTIMIFPEGTSVSERRLRPLKTGAARIALGAEARHDFKLGLHMLPVGINYFDPAAFAPMCCSMWPRPFRWPTTRPLTPRTPRPPPTSSPRIFGGAWSNIWSLRATRPKTSWCSKWSAPLANTSPRR